MKPLSLKELAGASGVSPSHLWRIEKGERFPSARLLLKLAKPLGFDGSELVVIAGYLSHQPPVRNESYETNTNTKGLNPYVAAVLSQEPVDVQRAMLGILSLLKYIAKSNTRESSNNGTDGSTDEYLI